MDTNILIGYLYAKATDSKKVAKRTRLLFDSAVVANWHGIRLYAPAICIAEAYGVLDKYYYCKWAGPVSTDKTKKLTPTKYIDCCNKLTGMLDNRALDQIEAEPAHVALLGAISPINQKYQFRRRVSGNRRTNKKVKKPMGGADCIVGASAILLGTRVGFDNVIVATDDQRLGDVMSKARSLNEDAASKIGLDVAASNAGIVWSPEIYPEAVSLRHDSDSVLRRAFLGWPLPSIPVPEVKYVDLVEADQTELAKLWRLRRKRYELSIDALPYSNAAQELSTELVSKIDKVLSPKEICHGLLSLRKAGKLNR